MKPMDNKGTDYTSRLPPGPYPLISHIPSALVRNMKSRSSLLEAKEVMKRKEWVRPLTLPVVVLKVSFSFSFLISLYLEGSKPSINSQASLKKGKNPRQWLEKKHYKYCMFISQVLR